MLRVREGDQTNLALLWNGTRPVVHFLEMVQNQALQKEPGGVSAVYEAGGRVNQPRSSTWFRIATIWR
jgi:hypothetical protein